MRRNILSLLVAFRQKAVSIRTTGSCDTLCASGGQTFRRQHEKIVLTLFAILTFYGCTDKYPDDFYGTYEIADSFNTKFEKITFYRDNHYFFSASSCMDGIRDTGEFSFDNGLLTFKSYRPIDTSGYKKLDRRLTNYKFNYTPGRICFLRSTNPSLRFHPNDPDTMMDIAKKRLGIQINFSSSKKP